MISRNHTVNFVQYDVIFFFGCYFFLSHYYLETNRSVLGAELYVSVILNTSTEEIKRAERRKNLLKMKIKAE